MKWYSSSDYKQGWEEKFERFAHSRCFQQQGHLQLALSIFFCWGPSDAPPAHLDAVLHSSPFDSN